MTDFAYREDFVRALLNWYQKAARELPFRKNKIPYNIWISEVMAQQTRIEALLGHYERFMERFPTIQALASADEEELMQVWQGLGYYSRAGKLQQAAILCMERYNGKLPDSYAQLLELPGIGPYTAGAIASIAHEEKVSAVDGNVIRVFARLYNIEESVSRPQILRHIRQLVDASLPEHPGDYNQALMELGALVCTPRRPECPACPIREFCQAFKEGNPEDLPHKDPKKARRQEKKPVFVWWDPQMEQVHLKRRPPKGLLAGLYGPDETLPEQAGEVKTIPLEPYRHVFSHVEWHLEPRLVLCSLKALESQEEEGVWMGLEEAKCCGLPSAFMPLLEQLEALRQNRKFLQKLPFAEMKDAKAKHSQEEL